MTRKDDEEMRSLSWRAILSADPRQVPGPPAPQPHAHARKRPNISISQLEALKKATENQWGTLDVGVDNGVKKALICRGLAEWADPETMSVCVITENGRILIRTQYEALKQVLPETRAEFK